MRSVVIIPARYASSRFPGKPLVSLVGKPMVLWVAELSMLAVGKDNVYIATDDERIAAVVNNAGFQTVMTASDALTGTDRLAQAAEQIQSDIYINVQGDEPLLSPADIIRVIEAKKKHMSHVINCFGWISDSEDPESPNIPKVITAEDGRLVYMSRQALPGYKDKKNAPARYKKQICIYAFTPQELSAFYSFGRKSILEHSEDIEILRFLDLGVPVHMIEAQTGTLAVDVQDDIKPVEDALRRLHAL